MAQYLTGDGLMRAAIVFLAVCWAANLVWQTAANARRENERRQEPIEQLRRELNRIRQENQQDRDRLSSLESGLGRRLEELERGVDAHTSEIKDLHAGQSALCRGVQALLDHELSGGNGQEEMREASQSIGKWLRTR